jgi:hypothetical protein
MSDAEMLIISYLIADCFIFSSKNSLLFGVIFFESRILYFTRIVSSLKLTPAITSGPMIGPLGE